MGWLQVCRVFALSVGILCGIVVAALGAHITAWAEQNFGVYYVYAAFSIAVGGLAVFTLPVMLIIDFLRTGAFTSMVLVELIWLTILWILWLALAALTVNDTSPVFASCNFHFPILDQICRETQAIEAFSFIGWIVLMGYTVVLLIVALVQVNRRSPIWKSSVRQSETLPPSQLQLQMQYDPNLAAKQQQALMGMTSVPVPTQQPYQPDLAYQQPQQVYGNPISQGQQVFPQQQQQQQQQYPPPPQPQPQFATQQPQTSQHNLQSTASPALTSTSYTTSVPGYPSSNYPQV